MWDSWTYRGAFSLSLPRRGRMLSSHRCCTKHQARQTRCSYLSMYKFCTCQTHIKDTTYCHITVFGPVMWLFQLKCQLFLDRQIPPVAPHLCRSLDNRLLKWRNHNFIARCQTKRIKSSEWAESLVWAQATKKHKCEHYGGARGEVW